MIMNILFSYFHLVSLSAGGKIFVKLHSELADLTRLKLVGVGVD